MARRLDLAPESLYEEARSSRLQAAASAALRPLRSGPRRRRLSFEAHDSGSELRFQPLRRRRAELHDEVEVRRDEPDGRTWVSPGKPLTLSSTGARPAR